MKLYRIFLTSASTLKFWCSLLLAVLLSVSVSCKRQGVDNKLKDNASDSAAFFKPDPQRVPEQEITTLATGQQAVNFNLPDVSGRYYSLDDFKEAEVLVLIFTCNHCPTAQAYEDRIIRFTEDYKNRKVAVAAIMPNSVYSLLLEECGYSDLDDTYESMIIRAKDKKFNFPYLYDGDNEEVSIKYGPTTTPHAFVFNRKRELVYSGRLDAFEKPGTANAEDLRDAVDATLNGEPVKTPVNKAFGCSVKWAWKVEWTDKVNSDWKKRTVSLVKINKKDLTAIRENNSDKLRLINVWATWCGPCIIEFPELVNIHRMYADRNFEFISLSADRPSAEEKVLSFLQSQHASVTNYLFNSENKYEMIEAVDSSWNGALPYSLLVEPGGKIIYSIQGTVDLFKLKKAIIEHPSMGRYY